MANVQSATFAALMPAAFRTGTEVTLTQLFAALELDEGMPILQKAETVVRTLNSIGLCISPSIGVGDFDSSRIMRSLEMPVPTVERIRGQIAAGESEVLEFKSSYLFNRDESRQSPTVKPQDLHFASVVHSALKTVCAFANTQGGTLLIGVQDDGVCVGIEDDYRIVAPDGNGSMDKWQRRFRQDIEGQFKDGKCINEFVSIALAPFTEKVTVARINVLPRRRLTFIKKEKGGGYTPYRRQGNRSIEIPYEDIEEFLSAKRH